MHLEDGRPKRNREIILRERNLWLTDRKILQGCKKHSPTRDDYCAVRILSLQQDFASQRSLISKKLLKSVGIKSSFFQSVNVNLI